MKKVIKGLSRREWFAGQAMQKMIELYPARKEKDVALTSLIYADAMMSVLDEKDQPDEEKESEL